MSLRSPRAPWTCAQCLLKQESRTVISRRSIATTTAPPPPPPPSGAAHLTNRRLISLHGPDSPKFLQGLITNNVLPPPARQGSFYAAFLTGQGRVVVDVFVYPTLGSSWHGEDSDPGYLVEVDADEAEILAKHIKKHKLRSKFKMRILEANELGVWSSWREEGRWTAHSTVDGGGGLSTTEAGYVSATDARAPGMGTRLLLPSSSQSSSRLPKELELEEAPLSAYTIRRYLRGVPEGQKEFVREESLPMNFNVDLMGGIDFKKGCYTGQELTIRTHHTGVVRRRVLPVVLHNRGQNEGNDLAYDVQAVDGVESILGVEGVGIGEGEIRRDDDRKRPTGKLIARMGNVGLGLCRLEQMSDLTISGEGSSFSTDDKFMVQAKEGDGAVAVKAFVPDWIRGRLRGPKVQRRVES